MAVGAVLSTYVLAGATTYTLRPSCFQVLMLIDVTTYYGMQSSVATLAQVRVHQATCTRGHACMQNAHKRTAAQTCQEVMHHVLLC